MRILVLGGSGMLGHKLVQTLRESFDVRMTLRGTFHDVEHFGLFRRDETIEGVDVMDMRSVQAAIETARPDIVVNAVGIIKQLPTSKDVVTSLTVNSILPHRLAEYGATAGFRLICISTDCVFDGESGMYTEEDPANALDLYGQSKHLGEVTEPNCLTLRTSIIGRELGSAHSLVEWFLSNRGGQVKGFRNAIYSGFPTVVFADIIRQLIVEHPKLTGLYHVSSEPINKYDLLKLLKEKYAAEIEIEPYDDFTIDRSLDSTRFRSAAGFTPMSWDEMAELMAGDPTPYDTWKK